MTHEEMPVCPECFHELHDCCIGAGCWCDCQIPASETVEDMSEREEDDRFRNEGYC